MTFPMSLPSCPPQAGSMSAPLLMDLKRCKGPLLPDIAAPLPNTRQPILASLLQPEMHRVLQTGPQSLAATMPRAIQRASSLMR